MCRLYICITFVKCVLHVFYMYIRCVKCILHLDIKVHNRAHRTLLSQFRCRILPLKIETGRYTQIPLQFRLGILCDSNLVEDENHFLFQCHFYHTLRDQFCQKDLYPEFYVMNNNLKLKYLMSETLVKDTFEYIYCCYSKQRDFIYK